MATKRETMWMIIGHCGLYVGGWFLRRDAIDFHTKAKAKSWKQCRKDGDTAVKANVEYEI